MNSPLSVQFRKSRADVANLYIPIRPRVQNMYLMCAKHRTQGHFQLGGSEYVYSEYAGICMECPSRTGVNLPHRYIKGEVGESTDRKEALIS